MYSSYKYIIETTHLIGSPTISTLLSTCQPYLVPPVDIKCTVQQDSPRSIVATLI